MHLCIVDTTSRWLLFAKELPLHSAYCSIHHLLFRSMGLINQASSIIMWQNRAQYNMFILCSPKNTDAMIRICTLEGTRTLFLLSVFSHHQYEVTKMAYFSNHGLIEFPSLWRRANVEYLTGCSIEYLDKYPPKFLRKSHFKDKKHTVKFTL